jgi:hypothetical protein
MSTPSHRLAAVRAADLLVLHLDLYNLAPSGIGLRRQDPAAPAHVVLRFPPQHLLEEAFVEEEEIDDGGAELLARLAAAGGKTVALAGALGAAPSRVAFTVPDGVDELPAALDPLLEFLTKCQLNVVATAEGKAKVGGRLLQLKPLLVIVGRRGATTHPGEGEERHLTSLVEPGPEETAIELPYRLILSPPSRAGFAHAARTPALTGLDRAELWHSRLGLAPGEEGTPRDRGRRTVRAVWVRYGSERGQRWDPTDAFAVPDWAADPFLAPTSERDRHQIAHLTSNYWQNLETAPVEVERLALSALGGWLDANGSWNPPRPQMTLEEWENRTTQGRDHFVKIVETGFLFPFGHRASLIQISERKWQEAVPGRPAALRMRFFVIVRVPELRYEGGAAVKTERQMPLKRVRLRTLITPLIEKPQDRGLFQVRVKGAPFRFAIEGEDERGGVTQFSMPLVFVQPRKGGIDATGARTQLARGNAQRADLGGSPVALVPERPGEPGATTFPVASAAFDADLSAGLEAGFHPKLADADVALPAVEVVTGKGATQVFKYAAPYIEDGFGGANKGEVFAELPSPASLDLQGSADKAGGLISPAMKIGGLSRAVGPLGGTELGDLAKGEFDPAKFFAGALGSAKLLGLFSLDKVIGAAGGLLDQPGLAPKLLTKRLPGGAMVAEWTYAPNLKAYPGGNGGIFVPRPGAGSLTLSAKVEAGSTPKAEIDCTLAAVDVFIPTDKAPCIKIPIERIRFHAVAGAKLDVDVELGAIGFGGPLEFVNELRELIPEDGFSDPPALEVTPQGISSGFSLALPDVAIGMFALQHVSLGARFELPFIGPPPTFAFNFCTRNEPFLLTVSAFGGGGFFLVKVDPEGMQRLEASLEFGASVSLNFGVASGGVHVMAGIYFAMETGQGANLTGYFRAGGNVSVLGIVSISIELYLGLSYETATGKAVGRASLTVEIELCLFSTSVEITCERKIAGSAGDPPLVELLAPYDEKADDPGDPPRRVDPWAEYCAAYA